MPETGRKSDREQPTHSTTTVSRCVRRCSASSTISGRPATKNLKKCLRSNGLATRTHGNLQRSPAHVLSLSSTEFVVRFALNYAEQHTLLLPGRVPGYSRSDIKLLPSSVSKQAIWKVYKTAATSDSIRGVGYSTLTSLWRSLLPSIIIVKPMTDLCWQCQKTSTAIHL